MPVISSIVCEGLVDAADHARAAGDAGAVALDVMPPHHWLRFGFTPGHALKYFEAIHQAGGLGTPLVVVLNDNGMSIAPNVGALSRYFNRVRLEPGLWKAREGVEERLTKLPAGIGAKFEKLGPQLKESIKAFWAPGLFWEELDWAYMGVVDGHDVRALRRARIPVYDAPTRPGTPQ